MRKDIHDALSSLLEVAVFAWSVLELLLTRILPLAAFLTGHFVLQLCRLLGAPFVQEAKRRRNYSHRNIVQIEDQLLEEVKGLQNNVCDDQINDSESLKLISSVDKLEDGQQLIASPGEESLQSPSLRDNNGAVELQATAAVLPIEASPVDQYVLEHNSESLHGEMTESKLCVADAAVKQVQELGDDQGHGGAKAPFEAAASEDVQMERGNGQMAHESKEGQFDTATSDQMQVQPGSDQAHDVVGEKYLHANESGIGGENQQLQRPNTSSSSAEASSAPATEMSVVSPLRSTAGADEMMRRSRRGRRVLPPSLSQIKRTLMQRSRRAATSPTSSAGAASKLSSQGSATPSSPFKKKLNVSPRARMSAMKNSSSYDNFLGKFRKHFLIDRA